MHKPSCAQSIRRKNAAAGLSEWETAQAIQEHCSVGLLRAHRLARGWTLAQVVAELRSIYRDVWGVSPLISHQRISQWEKGTDVPNPRYLDALCRLYRTRPDRIGFGHDYSDDSLQEHPEQIIVRYPSARGADEPVRWTQGAPPIGSPHDIRDEDDMERRQLLQLLAVHGGSAIQAPLFSALRKTRMQAETLLGTQSISLSSVDNWEMIAHDHGHFALTASPFTFLTQALGDFAELQRILSQRQPLDIQKRLYRVMAQLSGLIAISCNDIGPDSHGWFHTARLAADETEDRALRAWVVAYEGMSYLWYGRPVERAVELLKTAQGIAGSTPSPASAFAAAMEARAQARLGRRRETLAAIHRSDALFERLSPDDASPNLLGLSEHLLRLCQGVALTTVGENEEALAVQQQSFTFSEVDVIDAALVLLDRAVCYIQLGEIEEGCRVASQALLDLRPESRRGIPLIRAQEAVRMIPVVDHRLEAVEELHELVRASTQGAGKVAG